MEVEYPPLLSLTLAGWEGDLSWMITSKATITTTTMNDGEKSRNGDTLGPVELIL